MQQKQKQKIKKHQQQAMGLASRAPHPLITALMGIFVYTLYIRIQLIIRSNADILSTIVRLDNSPVPRSKPSTESRKSKYEIGTPVDVRKLAESLTKKFSADDGIPSDERMGFDILFSDPEDTDTYCFCDLISTDCLHMISCMQDFHNPQRRYAMAWLGVQFRRAIRATSDIEEMPNPMDWAEIPLGKMLQYHTIETWKDWRTLNFLPQTYNLMAPSIFVEEEWYPDCMLSEKGNEDPVYMYRGVSCLYKGPGETEVNPDSTIENEADRWFTATAKTSSTATGVQVATILENFLRKHRPSSSNDMYINYDRNMPLFSVRENEFHFSARGNLMMFAHIMRMMFNRRPFLDKIYREKVTHVATPGSTLSNKSEDDPFIVSLHMRRGDSCGWPNPKDYRKEAHPLDSKAQSGSDRHCYITRVYLDALKRVRALIPRTRPIHVYLSTDDVGDVIDEILNKKFIGNETELADDNVLGVDKWHYLNYSRSFFKYDADVIEDIDNSANQPILGETAVADMWHLSHGHAFIGHLGSRFGKVSWLLATARRNDFIPFFSVDGHSVCCEIDEACGDMKPYITAENCLSFGHEYGSHDHENYFDVGSVVRKKVFLESEKKKKKQTLILEREKLRLKKQQKVSMEGIRKRPRES